MEQSLYRPGQAWTGPERSSRLSLIISNRHMEGVRFSALCHGRLYPPPHEIFLALVSVKRLIRSQGHSAAGRIKSIKLPTPSETELATSRLVAVSPLTVPQRESKVTSLYKF
jgi:hypothetical protein